jgi:hypothetical protein
MRGDSTTLEENLHRGIRETNIELFMDQRVRNAVVVMIHLDVIIDIDPGCFPFGIKIGVNREGFENRFFKGFEQDLTGTRKLFKGTVVEDLQLSGNGLIELCEAKERPMPQRSQNPPFDL